MVFCVCLKNCSQKLFLKIETKQTLRTWLVTIFENYFFVLKNKKNTKNMFGSFFFYLLTNKESTKNTFGFFFFLFFFSKIRRTQKTCLVPSFFFVNTKNTNFFLSFFYIYLKHSVMPSFSWAHPHTGRIPQ